RRPATRAGPSQRDPTRKTREPARVLAFHTTPIAAVRAPPRRPHPAAPPFRAGRSPKKSEKESHFAGRRSLLEGTPATDGPGGGTAWTTMLPTPRNYWRAPGRVSRRL